MCSTSLLWYSPSAASNALSSWAQYSALHFVSFPTQTLFKSSKIIPVMLVGKLMHGHAYPWSQYLEAVLITFGISMFMMHSAELGGRHGGHSSSSSSSGSSSSGGGGLQQGTVNASTQAYGVALLFLFVGSDSFTSQWQSFLFKKRRVSQFLVMWGTSVFSTCFTLFSLYTSGEMMGGIAFLLEEKEALRHALMLSLCSAVGQLFVLYTIKQFGPIIFTLIMTVRQMTSLILSCVIYGHSLQAESILGAVVVFTTLFWIARRKYRARKAQERRSGGGGGGSGGAGGGGGAGEKPEKARMSTRSTRSGGGGARGTKRTRTNDEQESGEAQQFKREDGGSQTQQPPQPNQPRGRPQILLNTDELRKRTGKKYCDEAELVPLLFAHGLIRRVRTIAVEVRPLSGESFDIKLDAKKPTVGEAKEQIERDEGTKPWSQLLCRVQVSADGSNVREFDQEPEELEEDGMELSEGDVIAMGVVDRLEWRTYPEDRVVVSEERKLVRVTSDVWSLTTTGMELTEGRHYWEAEIVGNTFDCLNLGVCRPDAAPREDHGYAHHTTAWLMHAGDGSLYGNGKQGAHETGEFKTGDRMGVLLDLDDGSLRFFKNGAEHGPGYPAGSVTGPVALAANLCETGNALRLLPDAVWPAGHAQ
eukprot:g63.t1